MHSCYAQEGLGYVAPCQGSFVSIGVASGSRDTCCSRAAQFRNYCSNLSTIQLAGQHRCLLCSTTAFGQHTQSLQPTRTYHRAHWTAMNKREALVCPHLHCCVAPGAGLEAEAVAAAALDGHRAEVDVLGAGRWRGRRLLRLTLVRPNCRCSINIGHAILTILQSVTETSIEVSTEPDLSMCVWLTIIILKTNSTAAADALAACITACTL